MGSMCTAVLIGWDPATPHPPPHLPTFGLIYEEGAIGQPRQTTSLCDPLGVAVGGSCLLLISGVGCRVLNVGCRVSVSVVEGGSRLSGVCAGCCRWSWLSGVGCWFQCIGSRSLFSYCFFDAQLWYVDPYMLRICTAFVICSMRLHLHHCNYLPQSKRKLITLWYFSL